MTHLERLITVIENRPKTKERTSSLIKPWLGVDNITQSLCVRMGYIIEDFFNSLVSDYCILHDLDLYRKQRTIIDSQGERHQIDLLTRKNEIIQVRELKSNTDLDNGKKRDTFNREDHIVRALQQRYLQPIESINFCPFFETSRVMSGLGKVEGLTEFTQTFGIDFSFEEFQALGRNEQIHRLLLIE